MGDSEHFSDMRLQYSFTKASSENQKVSSEDAECFSQRMLALYIPKFLTNAAASLMDLGTLFKPSVAVFVMKI